MNQFFFFRDWYKPYNAKIEIIELEKNTPPTSESGKRIKRKLNIILSIN